MINDISKELQAIIDNANDYSTDEYKSRAIVLALLAIAYAIGEVATAIYRTNSKE